jgi:hypothetical protein
MTCTSSMVTDNCLDINRLLKFHHEKTILHFKGQ